MSFTLGDEAIWYRDLPDVEERIRRFRMPDEERLWGWGYCRRSSRTYRAHVESGFDALIDFVAAARLRADALLVCGPCQNPTEEFTTAVESLILPRLGSIGEVRVIEDHDCVNIIQGLHEARGLIDAGCTNVVVLAAEKVAEESRRFRKYSLFSDFCLSLVVSRELDSCQYELVDTLIREDPAPGEDTSGILARKLEEESLGELLDANGLSRQSVGRFFYINLFQPIARQKAKDLGLHDRLWDNATRRIGHCYGADPLIGLDSFTRGCSQDASAHLLCASAREFAGMCVVRPLRQLPC